MKLNMFRAWQRPPTTRPTTFHVCKTRGCQCSFGLLMMGCVSPETCWASYKYGIIKFWYIVASCWIFIYESYNWWSNSLFLQNTQYSRHCSFTPKINQINQLPTAQVLFQSHQSHCLNGLHGRYFVTNTYVLPFSLCVL